MSTPAEQLPFPPPPDFESVEQMADWAMDTADGDYERTAEIIRDLIDRDAQIKATLLAPLISRAVWYIVRRAGCRRRAQMLRTLPPMGDGPPDSPKGIKLVSKRTWYDYPLAGSHKKLGDATKADLLAAAHLHSVQSATNAKRAQWMNAMAEHMPDPKGKGKDKIVRQVLSLDQIEALAQC